jgi:simple sugar transport system permease protein
MRVSGVSPGAAKHAGVAQRTMLIGSMLLGGALAGLAGAHHVLGARRFFEEGIGSGDGFLGIAVALLSYGQPWAVIPSALLLAWLSEAGLSVAAHVPRELVLVLQGVVVLALGAAGAYVSRLPITPNAEEKAPEVSVA